MALYFGKEMFGFAWKLWTHQLINFIKRYLLSLAVVWFLSIWSCLHYKVDWKLIKLCWNINHFLCQVKDRGLTISEDVLGVIAVSIVKALRYLQETLHVIHRDVKPSNVLLNKNGKLKERETDLWIVASCWGNELSSYMFVIREYHEIQAPEVSSLYQALTNVQTVKSWSS